MGDIKSAWEIASEKIEKIEAVTEEERLKWKYVPEGEKVAASYLKENTNLVTELGKFDEKAKKYVADGAKEILVRYVDLPRNDAAKKNTKRAMDGLKVIVSDKVSAENVFSRVRRIFEHYAGQGEQQRRQAYESLKAQYAARMQRQMGPSARANIDVERQPGFHDEWRKLLAQLDSQYLKVLDELKQELLSIK